VKRKFKTIFRRSFALRAPGLPYGPFSAIRDSIISAR
jgi:hypothetical protein